MLKKIFRLYFVQPNDILADVGCGKGRVIAWWLKNGCKNKIYGFELNNEVASFTKKTFEKHDNVTIKNGNIIDEFPEDVTVFYMYNPFDAEMMTDFKARLIDTYYDKKNPTVIYYHCPQIEFFRNDPRFDIQEIDFPEWSLHHNSGFPWYAIIRMISPSSRVRISNDQKPSA